MPNSTSTAPTSPPTSGVPGDSSAGTGGVTTIGSDVTTTLPTLPPQYSSGNLGFFTRQTESVLTSLTVGPDGALYLGELTGIPYADGYASIIRVGDPTSGTGFNGSIQSGTPQVYASGFSQIQALGFDTAGNLYVLEYVNSNAIYDPTIQPGDLPPGKLVRVALDGTRTVISGDELKLPNYLVVDKATGDVFVAINNASSTNGEVLRYHTDAATGTTTHTVVASGLESPRGMSFGPDGKLYVLSAGVGTPSNSPDAATAPVIPFIPDIASERGGYTGDITSIDVNGTGAQVQVLTGLAGFLEFNPSTNTDRVIGIGANGLTIGADGTVYIASGGGLAPETAEAVGPLADTLQGILKVTGLFGADPSKAVVTTAFNALTYADQNGPDGSQTFFNTESNLYDVAIGTDGKVYTVDAARNVLYGLTNEGATLDSATVVQKQPPILTPPQYAAVVATGGNPTAQYHAEITSYTTKNADGVPNVPGNVPTGNLASGGNTGSFDPTGAPPSRGEDGTGSGVTGSTSGSSNTPGGTVTATSTSAPGTTAPGTTATGSDVPPGVPPLGASPFPGPTDPLAPPVLATNIYAPYYDPFFGNFAPAASDPTMLSNGSGGTYEVNNMFVFGDRLEDTGNTLKLAQSLGQASPLTATPYNGTGAFTDGNNWTTSLSQMLGLTVAETTNFAYSNATARAIVNPTDPNQAATPLTNFQGQINQFETGGKLFSSDDLVSVSFGGNDITLPSNLPTDVGISLSVHAITAGMQQLADLGAKHFLVANLPDIGIAPLFQDPGFQAATGQTPGSLVGLVDQFNAKLSIALTQFQGQTGLDVKQLNLNSLFDSITSSPSSFGFSNITDPVLINPPTAGSTPTYNPAIVGQDPAVQHGSLFLDPFFDPTALGHSIIAETARNTLTA